VGLWILRRQLSLQKNMLSDLQHFSLDNAECFNEEDRIFIKKILIEFQLPEITCDKRNKLISHIANLKKRFKQHKEEDSSVIERAEGSDISNERNSAEGSDIISVVERNTAEGSDDPGTESCLASDDDVVSRTISELKDRRVSSGTSNLVRLMERMSSRIPRRRSAVPEESHDLLLRDGILRFENFVNTDLAMTLNKKVGVYGETVVLPLNTVIIPCFSLSWAVLDYNLPNTAEMFTRDVCYAASYALIFGPLLFFTFVKIATLSLYWVPERRASAPKVAQKRVDGFLSVSRAVNFGATLVTLITSPEILILFPGSIIFLIVVAAMYTLWVGMYVNISSWYVLLLIYAAFLSLVLYAYNPARYAAQHRREQITQAKAALMRRFALRRPSITSDGKERRDRKIDVGTED